jgi:threonine aldolase
VINLKSDTFTRPTDAMRQAMAEAEVGNAAFGEDPTVNALEARIADMLGKEAAMFVPSGTMGNQIAIRTHTQPGDQIFTDPQAHVLMYEAGAPGVLSGVVCRQLPARGGLYTGNDLRHAALGTMLAPLAVIENTHNRAGGAIWSPNAIADVAAAARELNMAVHMDGARLFNAAVATGIPERDFLRDVDSVSVCFSKGLGAPIGSALVGSAAFVERAARARKQFGGAWRQAGIVAAGALYALEHHRDRLADDHANARKLADAIADMDGITLDPATVVTNIIYFDVAEGTAAQFAERLSAAGVGLFALGPNTLRAVTSLEVDADDIDRAITAFEQVTATNG